MARTHSAWSAFFALALASVSGCGDDKTRPASEGWDVAGRKPEPGDGLAGSAAKEGACVPKTCEELGKTSGTTDDGCGKPLACGGAVPKCGDAKGSNHTKETAADLGTMTDSPVSENPQVAPVPESRLLKDLKLDAQEDWFKIRVLDGWGGLGNPRVSVAVTGEPVDVSVFYECDSGGDNSGCAGTGLPDDAFFEGCTGQGSVAVDTGCEGWNETGTAWLRIKKSSAEPECATYTLAIEVE